VIRQPVQDFQGVRINQSAGNRVVSTLDNNRLEAIYWRRLVDQKKTLKINSQKRTVLIYHLAPLISIRLEIERIDAGIRRSVLLLEKAKHCVMEKWDTARFARSFRRFCGA